MCSGNAEARDPDVLALDVVRTPELAATGWLLPANEHGIALEDFFDATLDAHRFRERDYAVQWFVDVGFALLAKRLRRSSAVDVSKAAVPSQSVVDSGRRDMRERGL
jgi:hypothetical protein